MLPYDGALFVVFSTCLFKSPTVKVFQQMNQTNTDQHNLNKQKQPKTGKIITNDVCNLNITIAQLNKIKPPSSEITQKLVNESWHMQCS